MLGACFFLEFHVEYYNFSQQPGVVLCHGSGPQQPSKLKRNHYWEYRGAEHNQRPEDKQDATLTVPILSMASSPAPATLQ